VLCAEAIPVEANRPSMIAKQEKMVTKVTLSLLDQTGKYPSVVICFPHQSRIQSIPVKALFCALVERADGESARNVIANGHNNIHCHRLQIRDLSLPDGFLNVETIRENSSRANLGRRYCFSNRKASATGVIVAGEIALRCTAMLCKEQTRLLDVTR
jgi:hypothetical protein